MKTVLIAITLAMTSAAAWAYCTTHTYTDANGRFVVCTTCCTGNHCNTTCM